MQSNGRSAVRDVFEDDFWIEGKRIQPQLNRITTSEELLSVQPKIMRVLVCLAAQPGTVVTKERLFETVWANLHVSEHVLSRAISELRKIFRDDPRRPRIIETIPKTGYRLIARIDNAAAADPQATAQSAAGNTAPPLAQPARLRWSRPLFLGLLVVTLLAVFSNPFLRHLLFHKLFHSLFYGH